jgi:hypothetical protein
VKTVLYKLTSPRIKGGGIYLDYKLGRFQAIDVANTTPTDDQLVALLVRIPPTEAQLVDPGRNWGSMKLEECPTRSATDKIKWFCAAFRDYRGITYLATQNEKSNIRTVPVTSDLLKVFFETALNDYSIRNYIQRINTTRDILVNGRDFKSRFPNYYDAKTYASLDGQRLVAYQRHLRELGWHHDQRKGWHEAGK